MENKIKPTENLDTLENFRPAEGAYYMRISLSQFWKLVKQGKLKTIKLSKQVTIIRKSEIDAFLERASEMA